ncbi:sporulation phosphorelay system protein KapB [Paenibacillus oryzisoli]|uniref:sporulation phosphorelay system protein KapB n=1 Tax=Paenibacillus oryzisoli TaxID=1850517 RepID=UPI003D2867B5
MSIQIGDLVTAEYKTGMYYGEVVELTNSMKAAVKILAVNIHPTQGDLHNPMDPGVPFFHQRRALAHQEIALMPLSTIRPYAGAVPDYKASLHSALQDQMAKLAELEKKPEYAAWAKRSLQELEQLHQDYFPSVN